MVANPGAVQSDAARLIAGSVKRRSTAPHQACATTADPVRVGWDYSNFIQIAHHVELGLRKHLHHFRAALQAYGRAERIRKEDPSGKWAAKVVEYKLLMKAGDPAYTPDRTHDALVRMLFHQVMA